MIFTFKINVLQWTISNGQVQFSGFFKYLHSPRDEVKILLYYISFNWRNILNTILYFHFEFFCPLMAPKVVSRVVNDDMSRIIQAFCVS